MIVSYSSLKQVLEVLSKEECLYIDTETYGLRHEDKPFSLAICGEGKAYYFNFKYYDGLHQNFVLNEADLVDILKNAHVIHAHNAKFDIQMLRKIGIHPSDTALIHCTAAQERVYRNNYGHWKEYSLDNCGKRLGVPKDRTVEDFIKKNGLYTNGQPRYDLVPLELISKYAINDVLLCRQISKHQIYDKSRDSRANTRALECMFTEVVTDMQWNGLKVDEAYLHKAKAWHTQQSEILRQKYYELTQKTFIDSNKELEGAFSLLGEKFPLTDKGNPSFRASALDKMTTPLAQIVKKIRYHDKMGVTYFDNIAKQLDSKGFIHPDFIQHGTETGRISCRDPNMNNLPHAEPWDEYPVRRLFVPRSEENTFLFFDYKQQEYRLLLDLAGEHKVIAQINAGMDIHQAVADEIGITRDAAKTLNFALLYGMGIAALAESLKCSEKEAVDMRNKYFSRLPNVQKFIRRVKTQATRNGYAVNAFGRRCHAERPEDVYKIPNHVIQGGCADIMKTAMVQVHYTALDSDCFTVGQVYDELILEVPKTRAEDVIQKVEKLMIGAYKPLNGLYMAVDIKSSDKNWEEKA